MLNFDAIGELVAHRYGSVCNVSDESSGQNPHETAYSQGLVVRVVSICPMTL